MAAAKSAVELGKHTVGEFIEDECPRMAAALSYYTIVSIPPLLILILLLGAEFTQVWAESRGKGIQPEAGAVRVEQETEIIREPSARGA